MFPRMEAAWKLVYMARVQLACFLDTDLY